ncbi:MAG: folate-binding protein [Methylobacter sp.]|nr:folate-binding protein [Methylobacter sp.]
MNSNWKNFLLSNNASIDNDAAIIFPEHQGDRRIYALAHLGVLTLAGRDTATFLQGQITCNINDISDTKSSLGAICNPKGRAISTFLLVKDGADFLMILPQELVAAVQKRLQMYVLRADVRLTDSSDELCLLGLREGQPQLDEAQKSTFATTRQAAIAVELANRHLFIATPEQAQTLWTEQLALGFLPEDSAQWRCFDIIAGIPWLTAATSEEFIPQMLNLDKLGGISFNKGCYTGQEIVARTHYLGKAKREMFAAECPAISEPPKPNASIIDDSGDTEQSAGKVLCAQTRQNTCYLLIILQISETHRYNLRLKDRSDKITLLTASTLTL